MQRNKFFIVAGTLALAVAGFLTTKANSKKFVAATSAYFKTGASNIYTVFKGASLSNLTTAAISNKTAKLRTGASGPYTLFAVSDGTTLSKKIHWTR